MSRPQLGCSEEARGVRMVYRILRGYTVSGGSHGKVTASGRHVPYDL